MILLLPEKISAMKKSWDCLKVPEEQWLELKFSGKEQKDLLPFEITRDKIPMYSVDVAYMVNNNTGYIRINTFAMTTFDEFMKGLRELKGKGNDKTDS